MNTKSITMLAGLSAVLSTISPVIAETYTVELDGPSFVYDGQSDMDIELNILIGDTVRWDWVTGFHNVVNGFPTDPDTGVLFNSGAPTGDDSIFFEYTFTDEGVYGYYCEIHENIGMISFVTVTPAPGSMLAFAPAGLMLARRRRR